MVSLDGYFEGTDGDLSWHLVDDEFHHYAVEMLDSADLILFGRKTYEMMASYWADEAAITKDPVIAGKMNGLAKIVFSSSLDQVEWNNSSLLKDDIELNIKKLKEKPGKDILILGSGGIVSAFTQLGLIDEYRIIINPIILGAGKLQFTGVTEKKMLNPAKVRALKSGVVILYYESIKHLKQ